MDGCGSSVFRIVIPDFCADGGFGFLVNLADIEIVEIVNAVIKLRSSQTVKQALPRAVSPCRI